MASERKCEEEYMKEISERKDGMRQTLSKKLRRKTQN